MDSSSAQPPPTTPAPGPTHMNNAPAMSPADESAKRKRQPRNSACQPCASLKMKCVPSAVPGKCERCHRMNRECVAAIPKPRKRRTESNAGLDTPTSVHVSGLLGSNGPSVSSAAASTSMPAPSTPIAIDRYQSQDSLISRPDIRHNGSKSFNTLLARGLRLDSQHILLGDLLHSIDYNSIQNSLTVFRQLSTHFPFFHINPAEDAVLMAAQRPFTTLAISAVTSGANGITQARLCYAVRLALSTKAVVDGERSLDLLVGLMVFLAWHHQYMEKQQIYQYLCLLAGMAEDLGMSHSDPPGSVVTIERDRAFLGCYYLCSLAASKAFRKANPLRWTDNLRRCAEKITRMGSVPSDSNLLAIVELAHALDDFNEQVTPDSTLLSPTYTKLVETHANLASNRLKSLKHHYPSLNTNLALAAGMIDVHEMRLAANPNNTSVLIRCGCDITEYIDDLLNRPPIIMHQMAMVDFTNLLYILTLMAKVSKSLSNTTGALEAGAVAPVLSPESILDRLTAHIANAPAKDPLAPKNENLVHWFQSFCDSVKRNVIHGQQRPPHARFNAINPANAADRPLPYTAEPTAELSEPSAGVLDADFLQNFMGRS